MDTNVFLRYLTRDDTTKARQRGELFRRAENGEFALFTGKAILAEIVYVSSATPPGQSRADIAGALKVLFGSNAIEIDHRPSILKALRFCESTKLDFEDCLAVAPASRASNGRIFNYGRGLGRVTGVTRVEPRFDDESVTEAE